MKIATDKQNEKATPTETIKKGLSSIKKFTSAVQYLKPTNDKRLRIKEIVMKSPTKLAARIQDNYLTSRN